MAVTAELAAAGEYENSEERACVTHAAREPSLEGFPAGIGPVLRSTVADRVLRPRLTTMQLRHLALATVLAVASLVPAVSASADEPAESPTSARDRFAGSYAYAGGDKQLQARDAAIEKATDSMFFVTRGVARSRVKDKTAISPLIGFSFGSGRITGTAAGVTPATSPENGAAVPYQAGGDTVQLSQKLTADGKIAQSFTASDGNRTNTYVLSPDNKTLNIFITVSSQRLPQPVSFTLTYLRK